MWFSYFFRFFCFSTAFDSIHILYVTLEWNTFDISIYRLLPRSTGSSQMVSHCSVIQMDISGNSVNSAKTSIVPRYTFGWSGTQSLSYKQPLTKFSLPLRAVLTSKTRDISTSPLTDDGKIGVLLLNLGGPETLEDVQPFLFNLFADPVSLLCCWYFIMHVYPSTFWI